MDLKVDPLENIKDFGKDLKVKESGDTGEELSQPSLGVLTLHDGTYSSGTFNNEQEDVQFQLKLARSSSSYNLASDMSHLDANVDRWINGTTSAEIGVQRSRLPVIQRSTAMSSFNVARVWCVVALVLPLFSINVPRSWICSPSEMYFASDDVDFYRVMRTVYKVHNPGLCSVVNENGLMMMMMKRAVMNSAEMCLTNMVAIMARARAQIMRLAEQQVARDCFAMAMDIVLVIYAFGFLLLSLYQADIIG